MSLRNNLYCKNIDIVKDCIEHCSNMVCHVMKADKSNQYECEYIVEAHIVCDYCSLCETQGDVRGIDIKDIDILEYQEVVYLD